MFGDVGRFLTLVTVAAAAFADPRLGLAGRADPAAQDLAAPARAQSAAEPTAPALIAEGDRIQSDRQRASIRPGIEKFREALALGRAARDRVSEAAALYRLGLSFLNLGEQHEGVGFLDEALVLHRQLRDRPGEAATLHALASLKLSLGYTQAALDLYREALAIRQTLSDTRGSAQATTNIGLVYSTLADYSRALDYYSRGLASWRALGERYGEAMTMTNMAKVYLELGDFETARRFAGEALPLHRAEGNKGPQISTLGHLAEAHLALGAPEAALEATRQALQIGEDIGDRRAQAGTLALMGQVYERLGDLDEAYDRYSGALTRSRAVLAQQIEASALAGRARIARARGRPIEARSEIESALDVVEALRSRVAQYELRASYLAASRGYYDLLISVLMELHRARPSAGYAAEALRTSERARARSLLDALAEHRARIRESANPTLIEREQVLQQNVSRGAARLATLLNSQDTPPPDIARAKAEVDALVTEYQELRARIRVTSPRFQALTDPQPLSLADLQQQLDADTLLLEYALGDRESVVWAVTKAGLTSHVLPPRAVVEAAAREVYDLLTARNRVVTNDASTRRQLIAAADRQFNVAASRLSEILLAPVARALGARRLVIVAEGALQHVPFAALPLPSSGPGAPRAARAPLVDSHEVVSLPSASVLATIRQEATRRASQTVAVFADPVFGPPDPRLPGSEGAVRSAGIRGAPTSLAADDLRASNFRRLPFSRREADLITSLAPEGTTLRALDFEANRARATSPALGDYRIVHFATHAILDNQHPELSGIVLSRVNERGVPEDGILRLSDIYNMNLGADLVVLSACQTGLGQDVRGEGLVSLARGFMYAGSPRLVASLWSVEDRATAAWMKHFYEDLLTRGQSPAAAVRGAQRAMRREPGWTAPYYWAAFTLQGEWR